MADLPLFDSDETVTSRRLRSTSLCHFAEACSPEPTYELTPLTEDAHSREESIVCLTCGKTGVFSTNLEMT